MLKRRQILQYAGLLSTTTLLTWGFNGKRQNVTANPSQKNLMVIFLRGGIDGLNVVVPYQEAAYYNARPTIAIPTPNQENGVLNLDGHFGLHPALSDLMPLWKQGSLAFIHACGSPDPTRSHFDAQDYMENGTPGIKKTDDGWMNRLLGSLPAQVPTKAVNLGSTTPKILKGRAAIASLPLGNKADQALKLERLPIQQSFDLLYAGNDPLSIAYQQGRQAREVLLQELSQEMVAASQGAPATGVFAKNAPKIAQLLQGKTDTQLAFLDLGGWDTHVNQGGSQGSLARKLKDLGAGLAALVNGLGSAYSDTVIVVMSEFGRTLGENGNQGTDHGHGNVMWVLGGGIRGGKVYGDWPGLEDEQRELDITTDFRDVLITLLQNHLQLGDNQLAQIFPQYNPKSILQI
ncbi:protein of unknown function DUF1501 [Gloeothece citriformis PCC 7424]|uniref:Twin-arginine translocation pathway signal n=1 Tax=Gloeothece citriformis (strain PCC 7424) TaxID=65393 RepID=B7KBS9_GLOC7|nr:DUF1501 domain-containing protein [Gloeothece citriformis]ACK73057.1 protein of unknown function DUF1501 [Gloeothece citriformis PCC 7424]